MYKKSYKHNNKNPTWYLTYTQTYEHKGFKRERENIMIFTNYNANKTNIPVPHPWLVYINRNNGKLESSKLHYPNGLLDRTYGLNDSKQEEYNCCNSCCAFPRITEIHPFQGGLHMVQRIVKMCFQFLAKPIITGTRHTNLQTKFVKHICQEALSPKQLVIIPLPTRKSTSLSVSMKVSIR